MAASKTQLTPGEELLEAVKQMKAGQAARVYKPEQLMAIGARRTSKLTQEEFAKLLDVSVDSIRDWEQGRRKPRGAARTLLRIAMAHPEVLENLN